MQRERSRTRGGSVKYLIAFLMFYASISSADLAVDLARPSQQDLRAPLLCEYDGEYVVRTLREHKSTIAGFCNGDVIANDELGHTLVPVYTDTQIASVTALAAESHTDGGFLKFSGRCEPNELLETLINPSQFLVKFRDSPVAYVSFRWYTSEHAYSISRYVGKDHRSKGIGTAAINLVCQYLDKLRSLAGLELSSVFAECSTENIAALRSMLKSRMVPFCIEGGEGKVY